MQRLLLITVIYFIAFISYAQKQDHITKLKCGHYQTSPYKATSASDMNKYDVKFYHLDIEATNLSTALSGNTKILATTGNDSLNKFVIELNSGITVSKVLINDNELEFNHVNHEIWVDLNLAIPANTDFTAQIFYNRPATLETDGIYNRLVEDWKRVTFTLSESFYARNWFACKQDLHDKADSVFVFITVDEDLKAGSNGVLTKISDIGNGKKRYEWKSFHPIDFYLISIAIADYKEYNFYSKPNELDGDSILIQNYLYNNADFESQKLGIDVTDNLLELFSEKYSIYPFWEEKYGHCFVPLNGAMEHQTMTSTGSYLFYVIAHELGHQWFGNNVTCATWQDIWINEGFASYSEYLAFEFLYGIESANDWLQNAQFYAREAPTGSVYIPFEDANNESRIFSWKLTYRKGLCLVHMIRKEINNDELFFSTLHNFQQIFADSVATGDDFKDFISDKTKINFTSFFNEWYYGEGYPTYKGIWQQVDNVLTIELNQTTTSVTPFFTNTIPFKITYNQGDTIIRLKPEKANENFTVNFSKPIIDIKIDTENDILKGEDSDISTSILSNQFSPISCYPNPFNNQLTIKISTKSSQIYIYDTQGKLQYSAQINSNEITINTENWKKGIYAIKIIGDNKSKYMKKYIKL